MQTENYKQQQEILPKSGKQIIAQATENEIIVYQAYNPQIANYAVEHQKFGGPNFSMSRMTWIKPNFMWMMYRAGWAKKKNQERILAITICLEGFKEILRNAVHSSFKSHLYENHDEWKADLEKYEVRLQWDPDHNPLGAKLERKAIQLGMKGDILQQFNDKWVAKIEDITPFVKEQHANIKADSTHLIVPRERVITMDDGGIHERIGIELPE